MDSECEDPASAPERALRRQISEVGAVCSNSACTDLCGGRWVNRRPYRDKGRSSWEISKPSAFRYPPINNLDFPVGHAARLVQGFFSISKTRSRDLAGFTSPVPDPAAFSSARAPARIPAKP